MNIFNRLNKRNNHKDMKKKLVLSEKKKMGCDIAAALNCKHTADGYIEGDEYIITWTNGHIFTLKDPEDYDMIYKQWKMELLPIIPDEFGICFRNDSGKVKQFEVIKQLIGRNDIEEIILATDSGREGELLGRYVLEYLDNKKPVYRFWTSSLTKRAIIKAFDNLKLDSEYDSIYQCARARAELDFLIGINFSRAYSLYSNCTVSVGRCITAILALICKRDEEIQKFQEEYYSEVAAFFAPGYVGKYIDESGTRINKEKALKVKTEVEDKVGKIIDLKKVKVTKEHPLLFNLTELQRTLNRKYGYTSKETVDTLEDLYLVHKVVSYPRSSSRFISNNEYERLKNIFECLRFGEFEQHANHCLSNKKLPMDGIVNEELIEDHHAIIPTENEEICSKFNLLNEREKNVFNEIVIRFFSVFYDDYSYESIKILTEVNGYNFDSSVIRVTNLGWRIVYQNESDENEEAAMIKELNIGQNSEVNKVSVLDKKTRPTPHYTEDTLLEIMDNPKRLVDQDNLKQALLGRGIGTVATRDDLIESLIGKKYIKREQKQLISTELGQSIIKCIDIDILKSVELTAEIEFNLEKISRDEIKKEDFMKEATSFVINGITHIKNKDPMPIIEKKLEVMGTCLKCKKGKIVKNKSGYGCTELKNGCNYYISNYISGAYIDDAQIKRLLNSGKTDVILFEHNGNKFRARLVYNALKQKNEFKKVL